MKPGDLMNQLSLMIFAADTADGGCSIAFYGDDTPVGSRIH